MINEVIRALDQSICRFTLAIGGLRCVEIVCDGNSVSLERLVREDASEAALIGRLTKIVCQTDTCVSVEVV